MILPQNGRIIIIDNQINEAAPLMQALAKNGLSHTFFSGQLTEMPSKPISDIRVLFLDMILTGENESNEKTIMSAVKSVLERIIADDNGPFVCIAWTKKPALVKDLKNYLRKRSFHFPVLSWEKKKFRNDSGQFDIGLIIKKLEESMNGLESFQQFILWENLVHVAAGKTVTEFLNLKPQDEKEWNKKMTSIIWKLAKAHAGKQLEKSKPDDVMRNSFYSFNSAFLDTLNAEIRNDKISSSKKLPFDMIPDSDHDYEIDAKINSKLLLTLSDNVSHIPGCIYEELKIKRVELSELFHGDFNASSNKAKLESETKNIFLEVTPICDFAQMKQKVARLLPGVLWPRGISSDKIHEAWYVYKSPVLKYKDGILYHIVFDFRFLTSIALTELQKTKPVAVLKQEIMTDIQTKLSNHGNRPGIVYID